MALTPGAKKGFITVIVAAVLAGGGYYYKNKKVANPSPVGQGEAVITPTQVPTAPVALEPTPVVKSSEKSVAPVKKQQVAKATIKKHHSPPASHGGYQQGPTHEMLKKELTSDQKALQGLAGDKL